MSKYIVMATWDDVPHLSLAAKADLMASIPEYQRDARTKGIPQLGSGAVFPIDEADIKCKAFDIPDHWTQIGGMDFGWDHPFAAVRICWDRDADAVYVTNAYRRSQATPLLHAEAIKPWGWSRMPWAWPHDGQQHSKNDGVELAQLYRNHGLNLLPEFARFENGSWGVEPGIQLMLQYMQAGRFKVFSHLADWFEEFRLYHRDNGRIVAEAEDLLSATRYAVMSLRHAETPSSDQPDLLPVFQY